MFVKELFIHVVMERFSCNQKKKVGAFSKRTKLRYSSIPAGFTTVFNYE